MIDTLFSERFFLVFEKDRQSGVNIWSIFDREKRQIISTGFHEDWLQAVEIARKAVEDAQHD